MAGIVLAAGESRRMGQPKQLLSAGGETLLNRVLGQALNACLDPVVLVLGFESGRIQSSLGALYHHPKLLLVENPWFREGMSTSLISGLAAVEHDRDHIMVLLGDMPHVTSSLMNRLCNETIASGCPLGAVTVRGRRSLPVVIGRPLYEEVWNLTGDEGARSLFQRHPDWVCRVETEGEYDDMDVDTPEDFTRFRNGTLRQGGK
ncbi:MAG: nucleotidyltransferase family protein [Desulfobacteraceae bacterium]|jgi:molybdenum cofactor cytidylyltransferase